MEWMTESQAWISLATLTALEVVLGIDNIVFISILTSKLKGHQQGRARTLGLAMAMLSRIALLLSLTWLMGLTTPIFSLFNQDISGRDLILISGGLFLLGKSTLEIHDRLEGTEGESRVRFTASFASVIVQITLLDIVFSLDSVITAIGMANRVPVMILAIIIAVAFMMISSRSISRFIDGHPTIKVLALSFLLLIGVALVGEGLDLHIPKGYIYFAMAFSVFVEILNMKVRPREIPAVKLRQRYKEEKRLQPKEELDNQAASIQK
ncbi:MAG: TerC family protein [Pseudomonadota bacterium]